MVKRPKHDLLGLRFILAFHVDVGESADDSAKQRGGFYLPY